MYTGSSYAYNLFAHAIQVNCGAAEGAVFKEGEDYELTDVAKESLKGNDGSEMGMYGGLQPYDPMPSYPVIQSISVDKQSNEQGKINVTVKY